MLGPRELRHLSRWCACRNLSWQPARTDAGDPAILIGGGRPSEDHLVIEDEDGFRLLGMSCETLAEASALPLLLDALDAWIDTRPNTDPPYTARPSPSFWNSPGSVIT